jgi:hypothetical protein
METHEPISRDEASAALALTEHSRARVASRVRGICEGHFRSAMTLREKLLLSGPAAR